MVLPLDLHLGSQRMSPSSPSYDNMVATGLEGELTCRPRNSRMIEVIANDRMGRKGMSSF